MLRIDEIFADSPFKLKQVLMHNLMQVVWRFRASNSCIS